MTTLEVKTAILQIGAAYTALVGAALALCFCVTIISPALNANLGALIGAAFLGRIAWVLVKK